MFNRPIKDNNSYMAPRSLLTYISGLCNIDVNFLLQLAIVDKTWISLNNEMQFHIYTFVNLL